MKLVYYRKAEVYGAPYIVTLIQGVFLGDLQRLKEWRLYLDPVSSFAHDGPHGCWIVPRHYTEVEGLALRMRGCLGIVLGLLLLDDRYRGLISSVLLVLLG